MSLQVAGRFYSWKEGAWVPRNDRAPLRVFQFREDAWQCPRGVVSCYIETETEGVLSRQAIIVGDYTGRYVTGEEPASVINAAWLHKATRLSTWVEWFDMTITAAAHQYLDELIRAHHNRYRASAFRIGVAVHEMCEVQMAHDLIDFGSSAYEYKSNVVSLINDYLRSVKGDLETRLCGEPGSVVLP